MCEFCEGAITGDNFKELTHKDIDINGKAFAFIWSGIDTDIVNATIDDNKKVKVAEPVLTVCLDTHDGPAEGIAKSKIRIHYCPMCGQKLEWRSIR